jgi:hypothetical protein
MGASEILNHDFDSRNRFIAAVIAAQARIPPTGLAPVAAPHQQSLAHADQAKADENESLHVGQKERCKLLTSLAA